MWKKSRRELIQNNIDFYISLYHCSGCFIKNGELKYDEQKQFGECVELDKIGISKATTGIGVF